MNEVDYVKKMTGYSVEEINEAIRRERHFQLKTKDGKIAWMDVCDPERAMTDEEAMECAGKQLNAKFVEIKEYYEGILA